ncbi:MAG: hypothetical protein EAZ44_09440 [Cytophagia bacterium]|nr:MAG: hypothetical protein EAZ44_09440 [Cytophagia bacterium]
MKKYIQLQIIIVLNLCSCANAQEHKSIEFSEEQYVDRTHIVIGDSAKYLPKQILLMKNLKEIVIRNNFILDIENAIDLMSQLPRLEILIIDSCGLKEIPTNIHKLKHLKSLSLSKNKITYLSENITKVDNLETLEISCNPLSKISDKIDSTWKISELFLAANNFTDVPDIIYNLKNLELLALHDNKIKNISPKIKNLKKLYVLGLVGTLVEDLPNEIKYIKHNCLIHLNKTPLSKNKKRIDEINKMFKTEYNVVQID